MWLILSCLFGHRDIEIRAKSIDLLQDPKPDLPLAFIHEGVAIAGHDRLEDLGLAQQSPDEGAELATLHQQHEGFGIGTFLAADLVLAFADLPGIAQIADLCHPAPPVLRVAALVGPAPPS